MKPILYGPNEKEYTTNGIGVLGDCIKCTVTQERNGLFELAMTYPTNGIHYDEIALRSQILADVDNVSQPQPFRVYEITRPMNGRVKISARHISYDLAGIPVSPFSSTSATGAMSGTKSNAAVECPFEFWTDKSTTANMHVNAPMAIWELLGGTQGSILDVYGGEYEFDRYTVKLHNERGYNRGVTIRYGKNLTDIEQDENCEAVYTGVYPYWSSTDGEIVQLDNKIVNASGNYSFTRIMPLDLSQEWEDAPTQAQLKSKAETYITANNIGVPKVSLKVSFVQLAWSEEYKALAILEQVGLCDAVTVEFPKLGVSATAKCVKTVWDCLEERYESIELGDAKTNLADAIAAQEKELEEKTKPSYYQTAVMALTASILGAKGGAVRLLDTDNDGSPDTLYIADNPDPEKTKKVWRFNYEGWGASQDGYNGPFTLGASFDAGLLADFITAGTLRAGLIKSGRIQDAKGLNYWDMDTGEFHLSVATDVGGNTVSGIAQTAADNALGAAKDYANGTAANALGEANSYTNTMFGTAKEYADGVAGFAKSDAVAQANEYSASILANYDAALTAAQVFNKLTNNGQIQGIFMQDGQLYVNAEALAAGTLSANLFNLSGAFHVYKADGTYGGVLGFLSGSNDNGHTDGVGLIGPNGDTYAIITDNGVRLQAGTYNIFLTKSGQAVVNCNNFDVIGNIRCTGSVTEYHSFS